MEFLNKYNPKHYNAYLSIIGKIIGKHTDLHSWIKSLATNDILVWLNSFYHLHHNNEKFFEECTILTTLTIRLFALELDIQHVELKNKEIEKLLLRVKRALSTELAYRKDVIETTPKYTIIKDMEEDY